MSWNISTTRTLFGLSLLLAVLHFYAAETAVAKPNSGKNLFSSPDADTDVIPTFVGKNGLPYNAGRELKSPGLSDIKLLPSLTKDQRSAVDKIQSELNLRISSLREHVRTLEGKLVVMKGHPGEQVTVGKPGGHEETLPSANEIKSKIADVKADMTSKQREAALQAMKLLSDTQVKELESMRKGELVINDAATSSSSPASRKALTMPPAPHPKRGLLQKLKSALQ